MVNQTHQIIAFGYKRRQCGAVELVELLLTFGVRSVILNVRIYSLLWIAGLLKLMDREVRASCFSQSEPYLGIGRTCIYACVLGISDVIFNRRRTRIKL